MTPLVVNAPTIIDDDAYEDDVISDHLAMEAVVQIITIIMVVLFALL